MQPDKNTIPETTISIPTSTPIATIVTNTTTDTDKKIDEMAREAYLMRREIAVIAAVFFLALICIVMFAIGSMTQINLPV